MMNIQPMAVYLYSLYMVFGIGLAQADAGHLHHDQPPMQRMHHHWNAPPAAAERRNPVTADAASRARGRKLFQAHCAACHGMHGRGDGPAAAALDPKPTDLAAMANHHSDGDYAWKVANGRGAMPAWKGTLTEKQIWDVVNYIQQLGASAGPPAPAPRPHH